MSVMQPATTVRCMTGHRWQNRVEVQSTDAAVPERLYCCTKMLRKASRQRRV